MFTKKKPITSENRRSRSMCATLTKNSAPERRRARSDYSMFTVSFSSVPLIVPRFASFKYAKRRRRAGRRFIASPLDMFTAAGRERTKDPRKNRFWTYDSSAVHLNHLGTGSLCVCDNEKANFFCATARLERGARLFVCFVIESRDEKKKRKGKKISMPPQSCVNHILTKRLLASPSHRLADYFSQPPKTRFTPPHTTTRRYGVGGDLDAVRSNLLLVFSAFYFDSDSTDVCETQNQKINMKNRLVSSAGGRERLVDFLSSFSMVRRAQ
jgi:hypothetical protein